MHRHAVFAALLLSSAALAAEPAAAPGNATNRISMLHCAHLFDADTAKLRGETTVIVENGRIQELRNGAVDQQPYKQMAEHGGSFTYIDLAQATCLPGLIDSHTHLTSET